MKDNQVFEESSKKSKKGCLLGIMFVFLIGILVTFSAFNIIQSKINKLNYVSSSASNLSEVSIRTDLPDVSVDENTGESYSYDTAIEDEVKKSSQKTYKSEDVINILLIGTDRRIQGTSDPGRADVTMVVSLNKSTGDLKFISFERGIYVPVPGIGSDLLTHSFHWGGAELTMNDIRECFSLDIAGYAHVDFDTFSQIIDILGGVDIELTENEAWGINREITYKGEQYNLSSGWNHLDGGKALAYCRLRNIDDNFSRIARQRNTLQAILYKAKNLSIREINNLADKILPLIDTDLDSGTIMSLLLYVPKVLGSTAEQYQVPEGHDSAQIDFDYEAIRLQKIIYGIDNG